MSSRGSSSNRGHRGQGIHRGGHSGSGGGSQGIQRGGYGSGSRGGGHGGPQPRDTDALKSGALVSNAIELGVDSKVTWFITGLDFHGEESARTRRVMAGHLISSLGLEGVFFTGTVLYSMKPIQESKHVRFDLGSKPCEISTVTCTKVAPEPKEYLPMYNNVLRGILKQIGYMRIYNSHYDMGSPLIDERMKGTVDIFPGIETEISIRLVNGQLKPLLSIDPIHKVVNKQDLLSLINQEKDKKKIENKYLGIRVMTSYSYKTYGIEKFDWNKTPKSTFKYKNRNTGLEETISFVEYYSNRGIKITNLTQPLIVTSGRQREQIHLIPELVVPAFIPQDAKNKLPQVTSIKPDARLKRLNDYLGKISKGKSGELLKACGITCTAEFVKVKQHVLNPPKIVLAPKTLHAAKQEWRKESSSVTFNHIPDINKKNVLPLIIYNKRMGEYSKNCWIELLDKFKAMQAPLKFNDAIFHPCDGKTSYSESMEALIAKLPANQAIENTLLVAFVNDSEEYDEYRRITLAHGIVGQAISSAQGNIQRKEKNKSSILGNIARQIINKFGFPSWWLTVKNSFPPSQQEKQFLFVGIDVFHAAPQLKRSSASTEVYFQKRSIAGYTAKLTVKGSNFEYCATETRDSGAEIAGQRLGTETASSSVDVAGAPYVRQRATLTDNEPLGDFLKHCLEEWKVHTPDPKQLVIIVYRDGVADSQLDKVDLAEVEQLKKVVHPDHHLIYTVVQKRVHNRFVMVDGDRVGNCDGGTVVDELARTDGRYNFFMIPCLTNLSTNKPVHYTVTYNSHPMNMTNLELQMITWANHHVYQNWAGAVKVPDVCQNAHKLAYTLGEAKVSQPVVPPSLANRPFYL